MDDQAITARDPVCGMEVNRKNAAATAAHGGETFYFCSVKCQEQFEQHPEQYAKAA